MSGAEIEPAQVARNAEIWAFEELPGTIAVERSQPHGQLSGGTARLACWLVTKEQPLSQPPKAMEPAFPDVKSYNVLGVATRRAKVRRSPLRDLNMKLPRSNLHSS